MTHITIISSSVRDGRNSHRVALYFKNFFDRNNLLSSEILDLKEYNFPLFNERLKNLNNPPQNAVKFAAKIKQADAVLIITPEYNGGYPASLKNAIDLLYDEWYHKPIGISTVSSGPFGGSQVITALQFTLWKIKAIMAPATFPVPKVQEVFTETGTAIDEQATNKRAEEFIKELLWSIEQKKGI